MKNGQTLLTKLNYKNQLDVALINTPADVLPLFQGFLNHSTIANNLNKLIKIDFLVVFVYTKEEVDKYLAQTMPIVTKDAPIWYCYLKGSSKKYKEGINRDTGWDSLVAYNLEPVRLVSINEDWSALRVRNVNYIKVMKRSFAKTDEGKKKVLTSKK